MSEAKVHRGVLIPAELRDAPVEQLDSYAACVKRDNAAFCRMVWALEDRAAELGVELDA